jgi:hypothetical protein
MYKLCETELVVVVEDDSAVVVVFESEDLGLEVGSGEDAL